MENIEAKANLNLKEQPNTLYVHGSLMTYHSDDVVTITETVPQGFNPTILMLNATVKIGTGPMKGTMKPFHYQNSGESVSTYKQVTIFYGDKQSKTIVVDVLG